MREVLAERILAKVMKWTPEDLAREMPDLKALANYKYDEYQNFSPGMRFIESLALWLAQLETDSERKIAYNLFRRKLVFISTEEMEHFVTLSYQDVIHPILTKKVADKLKIPDYLIKKVIRSSEFALLRRQCLFLGLSDGAHIDIFRRSNPELSHEQIYQTYEISKERSEKMLIELNKDVNKIIGKEFDKEKKRFRMVILIDDFSGSGLSYLRWDPVKARYSGKIATFFQFLQTMEKETDSLFDFNDFHIGIILYCGTNQARQHIQKLMEEVIGLRKIQFSIHIVHLFKESFKLNIEENRDFIEIMKKNYNPNILDEHYVIGKHSNPYLGFDECALPLIMSHNTPNNSLPILWYEEPQKNHGLFPRISRHGERI